MMRWSAVKYSPYSACTVWISPSAPPSSSCRTTSNLGRKKVHSASMQNRSRAAASRAMSAAWAALRASGFSTRVCLPASNASLAQGWWAGCGVAT
jgi:hypothetical protein